MGFFSKLLGTDQESIHETCINLYNKAKRKRPGKDERDYLKLILLTKPPYDYQHDMVIDGLLDEFQTIEGLADFIANMNSPHNHGLKKKTWGKREENLKFDPRLKGRNQLFFDDFWGD